jgi:hypothetical protein
MDVTRRCAACDADVDVDAITCAHCGAALKPLSLDRRRILEQQAERARVSAEVEANERRGIEERVQNDGSDLANRMRQKVEADALREAEIQRLQRKRLEAQAMIAKGQAISAFGSALLGSASPSLGFSSSSS